MLALLFRKYGIQSRNIPILIFYEIIGGMLFFLPVIALYLEENLANVTNVGIIFAVEAVAIAVFEIPSGAVSDLFGRKRSLVVASMLVFIAIIFLYLGGSMLNFIIFAILNALGRSLVSGTESAIIYDSLKEEGKQKYYKKVIGTMYALWPVGAAVGSIVGGYLASASLEFPVVFSLIPISMCFLLMLLLKEPHYHKEQDMNMLIHIKKATGLVLARRQLIILFFGGLLLWGIGESVHHLNSIFFDFKEIPVLYFGYISAALFALSSIGHYVANDVSEMFGDKKTLIAAVTLSPLLLMFSTLTGGWISVLIFIVPSFFFGLRRPIIDHLLNCEVTSSKRATVISMNNFFGFIGFAAYSVLLGFVSDLYNVNMGFRISALILFIVPIIFLSLEDDRTLR